MPLFFSAWQIVTRRSRANWRLLSSIVIGVLVAVALLSSIPLFSNALNDLGLLHALREKPIELMDLQIYAPNYPIDYEDYQASWNIIDRQVAQNIGSIVHQEERYLKSETFYAAWTDRPIPTDPNRPRGHFQVLTNLDQHVTLVEGRYPDPFPSGLSPAELADPGREIEALIGSEAAELFGVAAGDRLLFIVAVPRDVPQQLTIRLTGIIDPIDPAEEYWFLNNQLFTVPPREENPYITAPLFIPEQTLFEGIGRLVPFAQASRHWFYYVDLRRINSQNAESVKNAIQRLGRQIITDLPRSTQFIVLDNVIANYQQKLLFTQIPLFLLIFQIVGIILYYLVTVATMVIERQSAEIALLRSRGASTGQIFATYLMEGILITAFGGAVGPFLGAFVFSLLGNTGPFLPLSGGGLLAVRFSATVFLLAAGAALLCLLALLLPAIQAARGGMVRQKQHAARPPRAPLWQRLYLDMVILVIGGVLYWEVRERGSLLSENVFGEAGIDPMLLVTPMLFMVAVSIVFLRLFPLIIGLAARLSKYITSAPTVLSLHYMARNPAHYGRLILLLMLAASVGMFSASFLGTLERSYHERARYSAGSDVRLEDIYDQFAEKDALKSRYLSLSGVENATTAFRLTGTVGSLSSEGTFTMLAVEPESFGEIAWYRADFSPKSLPQLMSLLADDTPLSEGLDLPEGTGSIGLWVRPVESYPDLRVVVRIKDGRDRYHDYELGSPDSEDWQYLEADLSTITTNRPPPSPLSLRSIYLMQESGRLQKMPVGIYFDDLQIRGDFSAAPVVIEDFEDLSEWTIYNADEPEGWGTARVPGRTDRFTINQEIVHRGTASGEFRWVAARTFAPRGIYPYLDNRPLRVLTSRSLVDSLGTATGSQVILRIPGQFLPVIIEDTVDYFPTLDPTDMGFVIVNLDRLSSVRNLIPGRGKHYYPDEVWLTLTNDKQQREAVLDTLNSGRYSAQKLYDSAGMLARQEADPLVAAGWGGVLLFSFLGVVLVSGLGFVVYAYLSAQGRQLEFAILRTLGFSLRQIIGLVCLEQLLVIGSGMGIGTLIGLRLSAIMLPFLQFTEQGDKVLPPFIFVIDWFTIGTAYSTLTIAFVVTISLVILFFSREAIHRVLRMGDL